MLLLLLCVTYFEKIAVVLHGVLMLCWCAVLDLLCCSDAADALSDALIMLIFLGQF